MPKSNANLALKGLDEMFSTEESRQEQKREQVQQIPIEELFPFKEHPECCHFRRCNQLDLEHCGLHRSALLHPVQDKLGSQKHSGCTLKRRRYGSLYFRAA